MMEAAGFQVEQSSDSLNGSRKENESDKEKEKEKEREMKAKHYALQMEVMDLLTTVQAGREELSKKKRDLQDIARLVNDYKMREASAVARFAEISRQLDQRDSAADRMDGCLKVLFHTNVITRLCGVCFSGMCSKDYWLLSSQFSSLFSLSYTSPTLAISRPVCLSLTLNFTLTLPVSILFINPQCIILFVFYLLLICDSTKTKILYLLFV